MALYNLGVAAEVATGYGEAVKYYRCAMDLSDKKIYETAWKRAMRRKKGKERLNEQMEGRQ